MPAEREDEVEHDEDEDGVAGPLAAHGGEVRVEVPFKRRSSGGAGAEQERERGQEGVGVRRRA